MANLTAITITFNTPYATDGKKANTKISVVFYDLNRNVVAQSALLGVGEVFPDNGDYKGPFDVVIKKAINKSDFLHGSFDVIITPIGGDTWVFIPYVLINFSDGSQINCNEYDNRMVSELATKSTFVF